MFLRLDREMILVQILASVSDNSGNVGIGTTGPGDIRLKVHSNDSDDYIAIFKQTHASNLGTVQIDTPSDSNARPSRLDFARGGVNKWKTGMVYGDTTNGWGLSDATGSGTALQQTRFLVTPAGNVGIGTTDPGFRFHAYHPTTNVVGKFESGDPQVWIDLHDSNSGNYGALLGHEGGNGHLFKIADGSVNERLVLDNSGNLFLQSESQNRIVFGNTGDDFTINNTNNWIRGSAGSLQFNSASSGYVWEAAGAARLAMSQTGVITQTTSGTGDGYDMILRSTDSGDPGLSITRDNVVGFGIAVRGATDDYADFQVNNGGATSYSEEGKMRIYHNGNISIPGSAVWSSNVGNLLFPTGSHYMVRNSTSTGNESLIVSNQTGTGGAIGILQYRNGGSIRGDYLIATNSAGIYFSSASDYRFKENVTTVEDDHLTKLTSLRPVTYTEREGWQSDVDTETVHTGFIAHEVEEIYPEFVEGEKDALWTQEELDARGDEIETEESVGDPKYQTVAYTKKEWNVYMIRALQQLKAENEALKARLDALEGE